jgi:hypothetical protein
MLPKRSSGSATFRELRFALARSGGRAALLKLQVELTQDPAPSMFAKASHR